MENVRDWCISRQLWWGHQIPAWYCADCGHMTVSREDAVCCEKCGSTFNDIVNSGKIGCADCYRTFYDKLLPSLQRIHGKTRHEGKTPKAVKVETDSTESKISRLEKELKDAVERQDFEKAARIRDEIKAIKEGGKNE